MALWLFRLPQDCCILRMTGTPMTGAHWEQRHVPCTNTQNLVEGDAVCSQGFPRSCLCQHVPCTAVPVVVCWTPACMSCVQGLGSDQLAQPVQMHPNVHLGSAAVFDCLNTKREAGVR